MADIVFECSWLGTKITVYSDRIDVKNPLGLGHKSIPIKQIATFRTAPILGTATIETSGGAVHKLNIGYKTNMQGFDSAVRGLLSERH